MWPASALLTGNGVAFILRVPGTQHGDWWSTARLVDLRRHRRRVAAVEVRDPARRPAHLQPVELRARRSASSILGASRAEPLDFWWGPMSPGWSSRSRSSSPAGSRSSRGCSLLAIAVGFWLTFAAGDRRARLDRPRDDRALAPRPGRRRLLLVGPRHLARDPRLPLLHDHRPEDDPGERRAGARVYAVAVGLLAALLIAPARTEFWAKVAVLGALRSSARARPAARALRCRARSGWSALGGSPAARRVLVARTRARSSLAGIRAPAGARSRRRSRTPAGCRRSRSASRRASRRSSTARPRADRGRPRRRPRLQADALGRRRDARAAATATELTAAGSSAAASARRRQPIVVPPYRLDRMRVWLEAGQGPGRRRSRSPRSTGRSS